MEDYQSKYTGEQVEELLDMVANGEVGGGIETETDPIFSASPAASITEAKMGEWDGKQDTIADLATIRSGAEKGATALQSVPSEYGTKAWVTEQARDIANDAVGDFEAVAVEPLAEDVSQLKGAIGNKVDKVTGKGLSTEDFTSTLKTKLEGLSNYDDTELSNAISTLRGDFDKLVSGDTTTAIKTFNEVIAFLDGLTDTQDLESIIASIEQQIAGKMDNATLAKVATSGSYNDLSDKPIVSHGSLMFVEVNGIADDYAYYALPTSTTNFADEDDVFVTRNTLKTINGESLFGSGDITISGGSSGGDSYSGNYPKIQTQPSYGEVYLAPNTFTVITIHPSYITCWLDNPQNTEIVNEYIFVFYGYVSLSFGGAAKDLVWANDDIIDIEDGYTYIVSIVDNIACYSKIAGNVYNITRTSSSGGDND